MHYQPRPLPGRLISGPVTVTVGSTKKTLAVLLVAAGATLSKEMKVLTLVPQVGEPQVTWVQGTADVNSPHLPPGGVELECTSEDLTTHTFWAASDSKIDVYQGS